MPDEAELAPLAERLRWARDAAYDTVRWVAGFDVPDFEPEHELVALRQDGVYPIDGGRLVSSAGLDIAASEFEEHVVEEQVPHSTALHARLRERGRYLVGPLARYSLNAEQLSPLAREAAAEAGLGPVCRNPFRSIVVRSVEVLYACDEALRLIEAYEPPDRPFVAVEPRPGRGFGITEAPRGVLYHRYDLDADGMILAARIVPPTSQNQAAIEDDLRGFVQDRLDLDDRALTRQCEQAIRNYDPCISCATPLPSPGGRAVVSPWARRIVVIGVGNPFRRDDAVGMLAARRVRVRLGDVLDIDFVESDGEPTRLLDAWEGARFAVVIDAVHSHSSPPGHVHRLDVGPEEGLAMPGSTATSHGLGPGDAIALGRALGRLPERLVVYGIEGADFAEGEGLSPPVDAAVAEVVDRWHGTLPRRRPSTAKARADVPRRAGPRARGRRGRDRGGRRRRCPAAGLARGARGGGHPRGAG